MVLGLAQRQENRLVMNSGSEKDWMVSVPAEGSVTSSVSSIVDMVRTSVGRGSVGGCVSVAAGRLGISTNSLGSHLETVRLTLHLSGLSHQSGHSVDWQSLANQG